MSKKLLIILLSLLCCCATFAQEKSNLQKQAEAVNPSQDLAKARSLYLHAYSDYVSKGQTHQGVECGVKATALYYKENSYNEAFDLLRQIDHDINADKKTSKSEKAAMHYLTSKERMQMYMKMHRNESAKDQLNTMENLTKQANDEKVDSDLLFSKAIYYYSFSMNAEGNAIFREIISRKDSANAQKTADQIRALNKQIADHKATIEEKDDSLSSRQAIIVSLSVLAAILAGALVVGAIILLRFIALTRKQKKTIHLANETNALKAKFIGNISAHMEPCLKKLDNNIPEVKALLDFSSHIQTLSDLENMPNENLDMEETQIHPFCEDLMEQIRSKVKSDVTLTVNAQKMSVGINKKHVSHILTHLLSNAAIYTPEGGTISLEFKKRSPHTYQFLVSNTGEVIPEEKRENLFKPFVEMRDLTKGDGLGLPICKQMALKMNGDLEIDDKFTKGTRFVLDLHV